MEVIANYQRYPTFSAFLVAILSDYGCTELPDDTPALHESDLEAEGDVETYNDPYGTGDAYTEYEVELTDVRHKSSGRPVEISALSSDMRDALEQRVLDDFLRGRE